MALTRVRSGQIIGVPQSNEPFLYEVVPESNLPGVTADFIFKGAYFTKTTTVTVSGQTVNSVVFMSDNQLRVNITLGSAEGSFSATINNGQSKTFPDAILVVLGEVFTPDSSDYTITSGLMDLTTRGEAKLSGAQQDGKATIVSDTFLIPPDIDFEVRFALRSNPIDSGPQYYNRNCGLELFNPVDGAKQMGAFRWAGITAYSIYLDETASNVLTQSNVQEGELIRFKRVNGLYTFLTGNTVRYNLANTYNGNLRIRIHVHDVDMTNIKYIKLAT